MVFTKQDAERVGEIMMPTALDYLVRDGYVAFAGRVTTHPTKEGLFFVTIKERTRVCARAHHDQARSRSHSEQS